MLLSLVLHMYSMRCVLPAAVLLGTAPTYVLVWGAWRLLSAFLPSRFYQAVDDRLYCIYQNMVLFFFENYTGVQVRLCPPSAPGRRTCPPLSAGVPRGAGGTRSLEPASPTGYLRIVTPGMAHPHPPQEHVPSPHPPTSQEVSRSCLRFWPSASLQIPQDHWEAAVKLSCGYEWDQLPPRRLFCNSRSRCLAK